MNKMTIRAFLTWLDQASDEEINDRRKLFLATLSRVGTRRSRADIQLGLRLIDEEVLARRELWNLSLKRV